MAETLSIAPSYGTRMRMKPTTNVVRFDDGGYELRTPRGLNHMLETWDVALDAVPRTQAAAIETFLRLHGGVDWFWWTTPNDAGPKKWVCEDWSREPITRTHDRLSAQFRQVSDIA